MLGKPRAAAMQRDLMGTLSETEVDKGPFSFGSPKRILSSESIQRHSVLMASSKLVKRDGN